jgi:dipeptidyl aminopeptidase/acylaminoacyl peptidase
MRIHFLFSIFLSLIISIASAQLPTETDIWLLDMKKEKEQFTFSNPVNITARDGYDNQPSFTPDGKHVLYTSIREDNQADIYKYDIGTKATVQVTKTATSEYSPTIMPGGKYMSVVMVEKDSSQRLWKYPVKGGEPSVVFASIDSVGYHCWYTKKSAALFILTRPFTLQLARKGKEKTQLLGKNIGRSIHRIRKGKKNLILYVYHAENETSHYIVACDEKGKHDYIEAIKTPAGSEDLAVLNNETLLMAQGNKLFKYDIWKDKIWKEVADLGSDGITNITRLAVSNDGSRIAVVSNKQ